MKKKNNKGFFLSETMVVITIVTVVLLGVFKLFSSTYLRFIDTENYNSIAATNALLNIQKYYETIDNFDIKTQEIEGFYLELTNYEILKSDYYSELKKVWDVNGIYLIDLNKVFEGNNIETFDVSMRNYIKTLKKYNSVVLVISINENEYSFSRIREYMSVELVGNKNLEYVVYVNKGEEFIDPGYINWDKDEPTKTWEKELDTDTPGTYYLHYDFDGYILRRKVIVQNVVNCTFDGDLVQGAEYVNGQYTYRYKQEPYLSRWLNISTDGWGVTLTDKGSTESVTSEVCTYINGKPVVSMSDMFYHSAATSIDLSSFNTSNVTNMGGMFLGSAATSLDLSSFDTSNVTDMSYMFEDCAATSLDLSSFNTSNVTDMSGMFRNSAATSLDLSNFDTSNVTDMAFMFSGSAATSLDLSNFDTSKVTDMSFMFDNSGATSIDLSSFNTSNVTDMGFMFMDSAVTSLDLSNFNTSNVTDMLSMFQGSVAAILDLSSFDMSKVTEKSDMFKGTSATVGYARTQADANILNSTSNKPSTLTFVVK